MGSSKDNNRTKAKGKKRARTADRYRLYLDSVQSPDNEVHFFSRAFRKQFGRPPKLLREDFCGTAAICYEWVKGKKSRRAIGVDI
ncbi:MAG: class I SAM-dependent methyltransferase, partial [Phycisphaerae bacterium]|nr:class I SAM-dependent methyltransferase [Phycisphaerae bacterium]